MSPCVACGDWRRGQSLGLGPLLGAEFLGGRVLRFSVLSDGVARHAQLPGYGAKPLLPGAQRSEGTE